MSGKIEIGLRMKAFRNALDITQKELCNTDSISQGNYTRIEKGQLYPKVDFLFYLHKNFSLNIHWLLTGKGEMFLGGMGERDVFSNWKSAFSERYPGIPLNDDILDLFENMNKSKVVRLKIIIALLDILDEEHLIGKDELLDNENVEKEGKVNVG